jgi:signal transduction histidine kinase
VVKALVNWFTHSGFGETPDARAPAEAIFLRSLGLVYLVLFIIASATTRPTPGFAGKGLGVLAGMVVLVLAVIASQPRRRNLSQSERVAWLLLVTAASAVLAVLQPRGIWQAGPYFVGVMAAIRLERRIAVLTLAISLLVVCGVAAADHRGSDAVSVALGAVPWFFVVRLMRRTREQHLALVASRAAEARAAAVAERGRIAREMHDVLAHSLSALALQLESSRLLARDRHADPDLVRALDQAHHLAAGGLEEARRAIAAARGDELPGPERLQVLTETFGEQSGIPIDLDVRGEPRELAPDVRLAVYRTAQEALTNVRRHATPDRVVVCLEYGAEETVLTIEDYASDGAVPPAPSDAGYGLTGVRERAELLGGRLTACPTSTGFRVELHLPAIHGLAPVRG